MSAKFDPIIFRTLFYIFILAGLTACGGGGGDAVENSPALSSPQDNASTTGGSFIEGNGVTISKPQAAIDAYPDKNELITSQRSRARNLYIGSRNEQSLSLDSTGHFLSTMMLGLFPNEEKIMSSYQQYPEWLTLQWFDFHRAPILMQPMGGQEKIPPDGTFDCAKGGSMDVTHVPVNTDFNLHSYEGAPESIPKNDVHRHIIVHYNYCKADDAELSMNGEVEIYYSITYGKTPEFDPSTYYDVNQSREWSDFAPIYYDVLYAYRDLQISRKGLPILLNGIVEWPRTNHCGSDDAMQFTLHLQNLVDGRSVLMDELIRGTRVDTEFDCNVTRSDSPSLIEGAFYLSEFGKVDVSTRSLQAPVDDQSIDRGHIHFEFDSTDTVVSIEERELADEIYRPLVGNDYLAHAFHVAINNQSSEASSTYQVIESTFRRGSLLDLNDTDGDGMHDSWELAGGLNPNLAADTKVDSDNDSVSDAIEYASMGDPASSRSTGVNSDLAITLLSSHDSVVMEDRITLDYYTTGQYIRDNNADSPLTISANVEGQWYHEPWDNCQIIPTTNELSCWHPHHDSLNVIFFPAENGNIVISAKMVKPHYDYIPENNDVSAEIDFQGAN